MANRLKKYRRLKILDLSGKQFVILTQLIKLDGVSICLSKF